MGLNLNAMGYNETRAAVPGEYETLAPGGYVCKVVNAELTASKAGNQMLVLYIDIAEGELAGYFTRSFNVVKKYNSKLKWTNLGTYRQLITVTGGKLSPFFKGLLTCIENSNGCKFNTENFEATDLVGKLCGFIFGEEEYIKSDNSVGTHIAIKHQIGVDDVREGNFKIPELKKLPVKKPPADDLKNIDFGGEPVDDKDLPF